MSTYHFDLTFRNTLERTAAGTEHSGRRPVQNVRSTQSPQIEQLRTFLRIFRWLRYEEYLEDDHRVPLSRLNIYYHSDCRSP